MTEQYVGFGYQATELELPFRTASPEGRRTEVQFSFYTNRRSCGLCVFSCQRKISIFLYSSARQVNRCPNSPRPITLLYCAFAAPK